MTTYADALYGIPITERPGRTWVQLLNLLLFVVAFNIGCLMVNLTQFVFLLPLRAVPIPAVQAMYRDGIRYTKASYGNLLILMCQMCGPTKLVVTFETEGVGKFTPEEVKSLVVRDRSGRISLRLPKKTAIVANHQVYADWWYMWCLTHFAGVSSGICIVLKKSLKWLPIVGWGMQFFGFIFLARSWSSDRLTLSSELARLAQRAEEEDVPLAFLLYPEGTLVSRDTRPISKKYAEKIGTTDLTHILLPRSTGLHYSLRSLAPRIPSLELIDITVAYPGIPPMGYGQSYYTLRSIFCDRLPPPGVHMHIRRFNVKNDVPIGDISSSDPRQKPTRAGVEVAVPEGEAVVFDEWLRERWREKDAMLTGFHERGSFGDGVEIPLELHGVREVLDAFCFFVPAVLGYISSKVKGR